MSDNTALVLIICVASVTAGGVIVALTRAAVEIVRIVKGRDVDEKAVRPIR